jgi:hypothetical protein
MPRRSKQCQKLELAFRAIPRAHAYGSTADPQTRKLHVPGCNKHHDALVKPCAAADKPTRHTDKGTIRIRACALQWTTAHSRHTISLVPCSRSRYQHRTDHARLIPTLITCTTTPDHPPRAASPWLRDRPLPCSTYRSFDTYRRRRRYTRWLVHHITLGGTVCNITTRSYAGVPHTSTLDHSSATRLLIFRTNFYRSRP